MTRKSRGERVNKGRCCAMFGWTRYQFDRNLAKGMPYVRAAAHKGDEWVVNTAEVAAWVEEEKRRGRSRGRGGEGAGARVHARERGADAGHVPRHGGAAGGGPARRAGAAGPMG